MAIIAWQLCSKEDVTIIHPVPISELEDEWSLMVEAMIRQHLGEPYLGTTETITDEWHNGDGTNILSVNSPKIVSVSSLTINGVLLDADDYVLFDAYVELKAQTFPHGILNVKISYVSGDTDITQVVRLAAITMVVAVLQYRRSWGADTDIKWKNPQEDLGGTTPNYNVGLTSHLQAILKRVLRRPVRIK